MKKERKRILVRGANWVGDAVMTLPALQCLHASHGKAHIAVLAKPSTAPLYEREPWCTELIPYPATTGLQGWRDKIRLTQHLRSLKFDCAVALPNSFESAAVFFAARIPVRIGYNRDGRSFLLTHPLPSWKPETPTVHQRFSYLELLKGAGLIGSYPDDIGCQLANAAEAATSGQARLLTHGLRGPLIGVSPGAAFGSAKRWLPERFAQSAAQVARERKAFVLIFGAGSEEEICREVELLVQAQGVGCYNFAGRTTLAEFIDFAAACDLFLSNDSGPMHIASALGVPTVAVFGATDAAATGPVGSHTTVVQRPVFCSPCLLRECPIDHRCMTGVTTGDVTSAAATHTAALKS